MDRLEFQERLWETDPTAAISYEQLLAQYNGGEGKLYKADIGKYMRQYFDICPVPEDLE